MMPGQEYAMCIRSVDWIKEVTTGLPAPLPGPYADILWRNTNGGLAIWFMKGGTSVGQSYPTTMRTMVLQ